MTSRSPVRTLLSFLWVGLAFGIALGLLAGLTLIPAAADLFTGEGESGPGDSAPELLNAGFLFLIGLAAALVTRFWLRESVPGLGFPVNRAVLGEIMLGTSLGAVPILVATACYVASGASIAWSSDLAATAPRTLGMGLLVLLPAAMAEEWLFRLYFLRALLPHFGYWPSLVIGAVFFALIHYWNPAGNSVLPMIDIFVAGLGLGFAYLVTRSLWVPTAWHLAWNFTMGPGLGLPVSGEPITSVIQTRPEGPAWWTGGEFGPEASWLGIAVDLLAVVAFVFIARRVPTRVWSGRETGLT